MTQCKRTVLTEDEARTLFISVLQPDNPGSLAMLMAHSAFETGRWSAMYNWNFGNQGGNGDDGNFRLEDCGINTPPGNPVTFAAFTGPIAGLRGMVTLLQRRYADAWEVLLEGKDPRGYVEKLKAHGYFTAPLDPYQDGVESLYKTYGGTQNPKAPSGDSKQSWYSVPWQQQSPITLAVQRKYNTWARLNGIPIIKEDGILGTKTAKALVGMTYDRMAR